jgi:hypothetical protein
VVAARAGRASRHQLTFQLRSALAAPLAAPTIMLFRRWMQRGLDRIAGELAA